MVSNERMYSSLSGLPRVLLALLLVLRLPGEKAAGTPGERNSFRASEGKTFHIKSITGAADRGRRGTLARGDVLYK